MKKHKTAEQKLAQVKSIIILSALTPNNSGQRAGLWVRLQNKKQALEIEVKQRAFWDYLNTMDASNNALSFNYMATEKAEELGLGSLHMNGVISAWGTTNSTEFPEILTKIANRRKAHLN